MTDRRSGSEVHSLSEMMLDISFSTPRTSLTGDSSVPPHLIDGGTRMSNYDHSIEDGAEERLKEGAYFCRHAGWNFNGRVWWDVERSVFREEPWCYGVPQEVCEAATLRELMEIVNNEHGWD